MDPEEKQYKVLENVLNKIHEKCIALPNEDKKRNNDLLKQVIDTIIEKMKSKDKLFNHSYKEKYYGGSYYDGLKVGQPDEYDLDCLLQLPKIMEPTVENSNKPGYVHVVFKNFKAMENRDEAYKFSGLSTLVDENHYLSTSKVLRWIESVINLALNDFPKNKEGQTEIPIVSEKPYTLLVKLKKSGPALTLLVEGKTESGTFKFDVDLVLSFRFTGGQWPKGSYRKNPVETLKDTFFIIPKSPSQTEDKYWRLSFQEQEKILLSGFDFLKTSIRLIKKIRDNYNHKKISSYFIKTMFLWELEKQDKSLWNKSLHYVFLMMLEKYSEYLKNREIPYYWNKKYNLIENVKESTLTDIANLVKNILGDIKRNIQTDPFVVAKYLLPANEIEALKAEVNLGKKYLRQDSKVCPSPPAIIFHSSSPASTSQSASETYNFETMNTMERMEQKLDEQPQPNPKTQSAESSNQNLEDLLLTVLSEQRKTMDFCQLIVSKVDNLEQKIDNLERKIARSATIQPSNEGLTNHKQHLHLSDVKLHRSTDFLNTL